MTSNFLSIIGSRVYEFNSFPELRIKPSTFTLLPETNSVLCRGPPCCFVLNRVILSITLSFIFDCSWRASCTWPPGSRDHRTQTTKDITDTSMIVSRQRRHIFTDFIPMRKLGKSWCLYACLLEFMCVYGWVLRECGWVCEWACVCLRVCAYVFMSKNGKIII